MSPEHRDPTPDHRDPEVVSRDELRSHVCPRDGRWAEYDARGIFLTYVCPVCRSAKLAEFRPDVLTDPGYWHDEPIDEEW